jgi:hypothetical protein
MYSESFLYSISRNSTSSSQRNFGLFSAVMRAFKVEVEASLSLIGKTSPQKEAQNFRRLPQGRST